ncbi:hypothetical protein H112_08766 [Trichophyton rubrum D6]|uniref:Uncharacterized protein n=2 Tax=Trichophyton TaxID=5550 RepID=A0A022VNH4_TRIRU|nr:hypothetical protein H100_08787 [Trichophyton rubrum MR850]EZF36747.1 hypothetical protein H102_08747 [Trichophyton rubrum CBS 100081]EZF47494.1 hypothetical protein H103_08769 [Trichophyton rubrum CBS 288.86]EZF58153.1 hypothetical protein H104_08722 [Trichophyton rubrum CBS 289.86]EZF68759.1 hypothetical protein H105_08773 [Trichophyton soudanense CBS 452.61]EZF79317.1 hypothetical protein H110_08771 [Trichophyton rubrum MR1448]EZF90210.1 hypothetical protein H113_08839 [Trichophyton rub
MCKTIAFSFPVSGERGVGMAKNQHLPQDYSVWSASLFEQDRPTIISIDLLTAASCSDATALGSLVRHALGPAVQGSWKGVCPIRQVEAGMQEGARYFRRSSILAELGSTSRAEARGAARSGSEGPSVALAGKLVLQGVPHLSSQ